MRARSKQIRVLLNGQVREADSAIQGLLEILQYLASADPTFLQRFALSAKGRVRRHIARERKAIYPNRPDLAQNAVEVHDGWFLGKNISNREKRQLVRKACKVANLKFDTEVDLICD
jgi:predicted type IV restriction endonuclease